jgi:hypothetical protein
MYPDCQYVKKIEYLFIINACVEYTDVIYKHWE